jgi:hypothetical protein
LKWFRTLTGIVTDHDGGGETKKKIDAGAPSTTRARSQTCPSISSKYAGLKEQQFCRFDEQ